MDDIELITKFSEKLGKLLDDDVDDYNVKLIIGQEPNKRLFKAHLYILRVICPYFHTAFKRGWCKKDDDGSFFIEKPNIKPEVFEVILKYLYTGTLSFDKKSPDFLIEILVASDEFILHELCSHIETGLIKFHSMYLSQNFSHILHISFKHTLWNQLQEFCLTKIDKDPQSIFESTDFTRLLLNPLKDMIKRDDLFLEEIDIWRVVIIWCINQPNLNGGQKSQFNKDDINRWSRKTKSNFSKMLKEFTPFIRFHHITYKEFHENVKPFKEFIQQDIYEQTLWYYINPTLSRKQLAPIRTGLFDSALLKLKHFSLICNWINKSSELYSYSTLRFELKIRGTLDGFTADIFHNKFERLENTIVVMRVKDTGELIGGYNPWSFEHDRWRDSSDFWRYEQSSFIFSFPRESISLTNKNNLSWMKHNKINFKMELKNLESKSKLSRIDPNHTSKAFCISQDTGPQFGKTDLFMGKNFNSPLNCSCIQQYYMDKIRDDESGFCVDEYEIFQIFKK
ncbi:4311_t:CDS:2 [Funneliformis mosseae]|uniref:4311_t:CDS:1 n=1 Tax=Funneliformis mosseae TaxID=27381 RepID=A0A9N9AG02_FUNMO|nr:4311_t:CDS:2 [Funneliformis mosseae]